MNLTRVNRFMAGAMSTCLLLLSSLIAYGQAPQSLIDIGNSHHYIIHDTKPVIRYGPFLLDTSETSTIVEWITDTPCQATVEYGEGQLDHRAIAQEYGLVSVGTLQRVELTGLLPGHTYQYRVSSTQVVKLKPYLPEKGLSAESPSYTFTTLDHENPTASFSFITDTHEVVPRISTLMQMIDWKKTDFLVTGGDGVNDAESEAQVFDKWLNPVSEGLKHKKPLLSVRGNHDMRGPFARNLSSYLLAQNGQYYFTRDDGPVHLIVLDTGEDKPDNNQEYSGLLADTPYREEEYKWFQNLSSTDTRLADAPFRIVLMHQPKWGWTNGEGKKWTEVANKEKIDLVIAGHMHQFLHLKPGVDDNNFPVLVVGQDQVAHVDATATELKVKVTAQDGDIVDYFVIKRH